MDPSVMFLAEMAREANTGRRKSLEASRRPGRSVAMATLAAIARGLQRAAAAVAAWAEARSAVSAAPEAAATEAAANRLVTG
jgi:alpha-D-ribose 1-methylphosphonate 5-triphosphate synthase subunit PhnH